MASCKFIEINFPPAGPGDAGLIWEEPLNGVKYIWDGVKWDVYNDVDDLKQYWSRDETKQLLTPKDTDDEIKTQGYSMGWLSFLPNRNI